MDLEVRVSRFGDKFYKS